MTDWKTRARAVLPVAAARRRFHARGLSGFPLPGSQSAADERRVALTPARFLDMAIFYDTGKVASRREDLDFEDLKESYGIGMRFIGVKGYASESKSREAARTTSTRLRRRRRVLAMAVTSDRLPRIAACHLAVGVALDRRLQGPTLSARGSTPTIRSGRWLTPRTPRR